MAYIYISYTDKPGVSGNLQERQICPLYPNSII